MSASLIFCGGMAFHVCINFGGYIRISSKKISTMLCIFIITINLKEIYN